MGGTNMVTPYLVFNGNCREVLDFYQKAFESEVGMTMPYGEYVPDGIKTPPSDLSTWILHAEMQICGTTFWFADEIGISAKGNIVRASLTDKFGVDWNIVSEEAPKLK